MQFDVNVADAGLATPVPSDDATRLIERIRQQMTAAGLPARIDSDEASVAPGEADWDLLTPEERSVGGFSYPELRIDGPADIAVSVFKTSVFFSSDTDFDDEQGAAAQVVTALHVLDGLVPVPAEVKAEVNERAAQLNVATDGTIQR